MRRIYIPFLLATMILLSLAATAQAQGIGAKIQKQYDSLTGFTADFMQQLKNAASGEIETREGRISFKQPGLVRWETDTPEKELLIVGPKAVWDYFPEEETAFKYSPEAILSSKTMIKFLSGQANLEEDFLIEEKENEAGLLKIQMEPIEAEPSLVMAFAWVDPETYLLKSILLLDFYGNANKLGLDNLKLNPEIPNSQFTFTPPKGTTIEDNTQ